ncbi:hypothetical protein C5167_037551 [Papaver somniferum]|uniref:Putative rRNA methyltransferase n=1 Tax=Papaver somniferum TaxID=3469 RepID=A0A4Y7I9V1_PAPSO|nr:adoMet-dependent rRNA methyltransferase spb1-like [Papaver somniferum]RZC44600.1 hypothetical protein C5167_037551 [Papaver somniferum]
MGKKVKGGARLDKYYRLAKEQGYRSRASFKLLQLESKFNFLESAHSVLDLCAAPGGWMQVAVKKVPVGSFVLGVDLYPIKPIRGAISIIEDITTVRCRATIKKLMKENGVRSFDVVLHDGSPNIGGAWAQEATVQTSLVVDAVRLATEFLSPKGTIVTKIFRSQDYNKVLYCLNQLFDKVEVTKPIASRSTSAETYIVGKKYKAPAKIDPRLLDVKYLFDVEQENRKVANDVLGKPVPIPRVGYEKDMSVLRTIVLASDFVWSEIPLEVLQTATSISFKDPACIPLKDHILTTEEVKALCEDLQVLGKTDFKHLMKWRIGLRKALSPTQKAIPKPTDADDENKAVDDGDDDGKMLKEMEELTYAMERKKKRAKKVAARRQAKDKLRKSTGMLVDALEDGYVDDELFSLSSIKGKKDLEAVDSVNYEDGNLGDSENDEYETSTQNDPSSDIDADEEKKRYDEQIEDFLDEAYEQYITRKEGSSQQRKRSKKAFDEKELYKGDDAVELEHDSDREMVPSEVNPLVISLQEEEAQTQEQVTQQWFSQDIFAEAAEVGNIWGEMESENEMEVDIKENLSVHSNNFELPKTRVSKAADDDFEVVPAAITDSSDDSSASSSSNESDEEDNDKKAEILASAKKMLKKKQREALLDDAYNRYMFDDDKLPPWFLEEEKRHRQQMKPVTKEEIAAMKALYKEIDARTPKKVAQAKARKKRVALRQRENVRRKANTISDQTDITDMSKSKMIDKLYRKAAPKRPKKEYVVAKKGVQVKTPGKGKVLVDRRMKKDKRARTR